MGKEEDTNLMPPMPPPNLIITIMIITSDSARCCILQNYVFQQEGAQPLDTHMEPQGKK
jgi:hypothetical protein